MSDAAPDEREDGDPEDHAAADATELADAPAAGVIDPDLEDPPEPSEPG